LGAFLPYYLSFEWRFAFFGNVLSR
jgi:hypothetical protein